MLLIFMFFWSSVLQLVGLFISRMAGGAWAIVAPFFGTIYNFFAVDFGAMVKGLFGVAAENIELIAIVAAVVTVVVIIIASSIALTIFCVLARRNRVDGMEQIRKGHEAGPSWAEMAEKNKKGQVRFLVINIYSDLVFSSLFSLFAASAAQHSTAQHSTAHRFSFRYYPCRLCSLLTRQASSHLPPFFFVCVVCVPCVAILNHPTVYGEVPQDSLWSPARNDRSSGAYCAEHNCLRRPSCHALSRSFTRCVRHLQRDAQLRRRGRFRV